MALRPQVTCYISKCSSRELDLVDGAGIKEQTRDGPGLEEQHAMAESMQGVSGLPMMMALSPEAMQPHQEGMLYNQEQMLAPVDFDGQEFIHFSSPADQPGLREPNANIASGSDVEVERCVERRLRGALSAGSPGRDQFVARSAWDLPGERCMPLSHVLMSVLDMSSAFLHAA